jgi:acyl-CoA synthetase (AMP-forming)/AMP-acid ligase II
MLRIGGKRTIVDLFEENVDRVPDKPFVRFAGTELSYGDMGRLSSQLAEFLHQAGIGYRSRVALSITNRPAFLVAFLAILRRGATVVPLNTLYKPDEVRYALEHAQCQAIVTEKTLNTVVGEACKRVGHPVAVLVAGTDEDGAFHHDTAWSGLACEPERQAQPEPGDLAGIFYTSGTTARPKGVMISHENLMYSAEVTIKSLGLHSNDIPLLAFPLFHVNSLFYGVLTAIVLQGAIGLVSGFSVSAYWKDAVQAGATWTPGITGPLARLLQQQDESDAESRHTMRFAVGGMFASIDQIREFGKRFGVQLIQGWSMTETVSLGTLHPVDRPTPIPLVTGIGYPTLGQEIRLIRDDGSEADAGEVGEILYRTPSPFGGYLNDEQATREAFTEDGWFRTGDVARMDNTGYLAFMDRKKEMIKTKGENVAAAEVERAVNEHPGVLESAAIGVPDREGIWGERIEAYVVRRDEARVEEEELKQWVGRRLADFKVPGAVHFIDQLPKTPLGKIQRQKLR